jgi:ankyrin repeat protein
MGTLLTTAIYNGDAEAVKAICERGGSDPNAEGGLFAWSPLYHASRRSVSSLEQLFAHYPHIDIDQQNSRSGLTALHGAVYSNNLPAVRFLLANGANTALKSKAGETPEQLARRFGKVEIADAIATEVTMS